MSGRTMEQWLEYAKGLSKDQLIEFIKKKGNDRKRAMCEITKYQTEDYVRATDQHRCNSEALRIRTQQLQDFQAR